MINDMMNMLLRHRWGILLLAGVMLSLGACTDTVLDEDSARVIQRRIDTLIQHDTTRLYDTLLLPDTLYLSDTVVRYDTVIERRDVIKIDTIYKKDTLRLRDTFNIYDTVTVIVRDTIIRRDTIRDITGRFSGEGVIFLRDKSSDWPIDSIPIIFDPASLLEFKTEQGGIENGLELRLIARIPRPGTFYNWGDRTVSFLYLLVGRIVLPKSGPVRKELNIDPREGPSGLAVIPHAPADPLWFATGGGNEGTFWLNSIDTEQKVVYASFRARFSSPQSLTIDSAALMIHY